MTVYLGTPPTFAERVADACDTMSTAPGSHVERSCLHATYSAARASRDPVELQQALSEIADVAAGRDVTAERFAEISASALEISAARDRRAATRARAAARPRTRSPRTRRMVAA